MIGPGNRIEIEVTGIEPFEGELIVDGSAPLAFCGWSELRRLLENPDPAEPTRLTPTEKEIVALASEGLTNKQIGKRLYLSPRTVQWHLSRSFRKLGLRSRTELAARWSGGRD